MQNQTCKSIPRKPERLWSPASLARIANSPAALLASQLRKAALDLRWGPLSTALTAFEVDMQERPDWAFRNGWNARHLASIGRIILDAEEALRQAGDL